jgi:hypothetical protein
MGHLNSEARQLDFTGKRCKRFFSDGQRLQSEENKRRIYTFLEIKMKGFSSQQREEPDIGFGSPFFL